MRKLLLSAIVTLSTCLPVLSQEQANIHKTKANEFLRQGKNAEAIGELSKAIAAEPENGRHLIDRATLYSLVKDYQSLNADVEKAISLDPNDEQIVLFGATRVYTLARQCDKALSVTDAFISRNPQNDRAYSTRSMVNGCLKNLPAAMNDISVAIDLKPENAYYQATRARLLSEMGDSENAMEAFQGIIDSLEARLAGEQRQGGKFLRGNELATIYSIRARVHERSDQLEKAIADYTRAYEVSGELLYLRHRAEAHKKAKMYPAAIADFDKIIAEDKRETSHAYIARGDLHMMVGNYEKAVADFEQALKLGTPIKSLVETKLAAAKQKLNPAQQ